MASTRFRVTFNGFTVISETWDDATNTDGQHDEVFFKSVNKKAKSNGTIVYGGDSNTFVSATMGDVSSPATLGRRIKAGRAQRPWWQGGGFNGGLINGDQFPPIEPWAPPRPEELGRDYPPCMIWEDDIADDEVVHLVPSIWEWDGGAGAANGWLSWQVATDAQFGERAKRAFGPVAGPYDWIFEAVSLGIQTAGTLQGQVRRANLEIDQLGQRGTQTIRTMESSNQRSSSSPERLPRIWSRPIQPAAAKESYRFNMWTTQSCAATMCFIFRCIVSAAMHTQATRSSPARV